MYLKSWYTTGGGLGGGGGGGWDLETKQEWSLETKNKELYMIHIVVLAHGLLKHTQTHTIHRMLKLWLALHVKQHFVYVTGQCFAVSVNKHTHENRQTPEAFIATTHSCLQLITFWHCDRASQGCRSQQNVVQSSMNLHWTLWFGACCSYMGTTLQLLMSWS